MDLFPSGIECLLEEPVTFASSRRPVLAQSEPCRTGRVNRRGIFLIILQPFCINTSLPFPSPPPTAPPQRHSVICHHTEAPSLLSQPPCRLPHLTIIPDCFSPGHLFPWLWIFPSPPWTRFVSRVGSTLWKLSGSPRSMMRSMPGTLELGLLHAQHTHQPSLTACERSQHPSAHALPRSEP